METNYLWVVTDTNKLNFKFKDRFYNTRHKNNRWLNSVKKYPDVETNYDDKYGKRTTKKIDNVHGTSFLTVHLCEILQFKMLNKDRHYL